VSEADAGAAQAYPHRRFRRALYHLGFDLSRNPLCDQIDSTATPHGGRPVFFLAGVIVAMRSLSGGSAPKSSFAEWRAALIVRRACFSAALAASLLPRQWVPSGLASLLVATVPIYIALLAWLTPAPRLVRAPGFARARAGFIGVGILVSPALSAPPVGGSQHASFRDANPFFSDLFFGRSGQLYSRRARNSASPFLSSAQTMLCGGGLMIIAGLAHGESARLISAR
jgi:drug/metabolite transporter (DMT)-like permease